MRCRDRATDACGSALAGTRKGTDGFTLIEVLLFIVIIALLLAFLVPNLVLITERARRAAVRNNMHVVQAALEAYAVDNQGRLPAPRVSWRHRDSAGIALWMPGGSPTAKPPQVGRMPVNPYTGLGYNSRDTITDLDYQTLHGRLAPGQAARRLGSDIGCPYSGFRRIPDWPGGIGIATSVSRQPNAGTAEYGIYGYGRSAERPMYDMAAGADGKPDSARWIFVVLHN